MYGHLIACGWYHYDTFLRIVNGKMSKISLGYSGFVCIPNFRAQQSMGYIS
ncbi:hypothetical protein DA2_0126 [Desulfovibrio sp. A2]|nr:hypothetical protein DA2_0126 [Desulfovibrio sp. A2]